jgi:sec-independent protein translocase protein TatA
MTLLAFGMPAAPEWIVIGLLVLVLFGPKKIPEIARGLGKALGELQRAKEDFHREITGVPPLPKIESPQGVHEVHDLATVGTETPCPTPATSDAAPHSSAAPAGESAEKPS